LLFDYKNKNKKITHVAPTCPLTGSKLQQKVNLGGLKRVVFFAKITTLRNLGVKSVIKPKIKWEMVTGVKKIIL